MTHTILRIERHTRCQKNDGTIDQIFENHGFSPNEKIMKNESFDEASKYALDANQKGRKTSMRFDIFL